MATHGSEEQRNRVYYSQRLMGEDGSTRARGLRGLPAWVAVVWIVACVGLALQGVQRATLTIKGGAAGGCVDQH